MAQSHASQFSGIFEAVMRNNLGDVLYEQQKYMDARTEYQEAVRLDPGNKSFQEDLNRTAGYGR
jgi:Flp pilus assembly protein TadD